MKKTIYILLTALLSLVLIGAKAQETPPSGLKSVNAQFYINLADSSVWQNKGLPYGWQRIARYKDIKNFVTGTQLQLAKDSLVSLYTTQTIMGDKTYNGITTYQNAIKIDGNGTDGSQGFRFKYTGGYDDLYYNPAYRNLTWNRDFNFNGTIFGLQSAFFNRASVDTPPVGATDVVRLVDLSAFSTTIAKTYAKKDTLYNFEYPLDFAFRPFNIFKLNGSWHASKSVKDLVSAKIPNMQPYYTNYTSGSNSNDGLTPQTPVKTIAYAYSIGARLIYKLDNYGNTDDAGSITGDGTDLFVIGNGKGVTYITSSPATAPTWSLVSGTTYSTTTTLPKRVIDMLYADTTGHPLELIVAPDLATCQATPNSSYVNGTTVNINLSDGRVPDANVKVLTTGHTFTYTANAGYIYTEGVTFMGGGSQGTFAALGTTATATTTSLAYNCEYIYGESPTYTSDGGGGFLKDNVNSWIENCAAYGNARDGFNYKARLSTVKPWVIEINCVSSDNGLLQVGGNSTVNASSVHNAITVLRIAGLGYKNHGPNFIDIEGAKSLNIGVKASYSVGVQSVPPVFIDDFGDFAIGSSTNLVTKMWLVDCISNDKRYSIGRQTASTNSTIIIDSATTFRVPPINTIIGKYVTGAGSLYNFSALSSYTAKVAPVSQGGTGTVTPPTVGQVLVATSTSVYTPTNILPNGTNAVTQTAGNNSTRLATTAYVDRVKYLRLTASGTGAATTISIPHGLTGVTSASIVNVQAINVASQGIQSISADATNINIVYSAAPVTGTNNLSYNVIIKP